MKKIIPCFLLFFLLFIPMRSGESAFADDRVTVRFYFDEEVVSSTSVLIGSEISPLSYTTVKNLLKGRNVDLVPGTVYEWRMGSASGEKTGAFVAQTDTDLYLVSTGVTDAKRSVTYRYDYLDDTHFRFQTIDYLYGAEYSAPTQIDGRSVTSRLYLSEKYGAVANNEFNAPAYLLEDATVYVVLTEDATYTLDGKTCKSAYAQTPVAPEKKNHSLVGFFTDAELTVPYTGVAVNGLTLFTKWERVSYAVTVDTGEEPTELTVTIEDPTLEKKTLPDGYVWTVDGQEVSFPYTVSSDLTLRGMTPQQISEIKEKEAAEANAQKSLSRDEIIAVSIIGAAFVAVGAYSLIRFLVKKKKKQTKEERKKTDTDKQ